MARHSSITQKWDVADSGIGGKSETASAFTRSRLSRLPPLSGGNMAIHGFGAEIEIIGVNPFVFLPPDILSDIFRQAQKDRGAIPVRGSVNGVPYRQTLVKCGGAWRFYINAVMLKNSPQRIGERIEGTIEFDPEPRNVAMPEPFRSALSENQKALAVFESLPPSRQLEIVRYLANLKTGDSLTRNVKRAIDFLEGKGRFVGRDGP